MLVGILAGANLVTILLMWTACWSTHISPALYPKLSQAGLLFPIFLALNIAFILVWLFIAKRWMLLSLLGIALCWGYTQDYCPVNLDKEPTGKNILVLSYNVASLTAASNDVFDGHKAIDYITSSGADLICLQECPGSGKMYNLLAHRMDSLNYHMRHGVGMCIISRWPFVGDVVYKTVGAFGNGSLAWCIDMDGDTTLVINNHLQSNGISAEEKSEYGDAIESYDKERMKASGRLLFSRLTQAAAKRAEQTDSVCQLISRYSGHQIIVAGDFNDTPISHTFQRISDQLKSAFSESGNGLGISFVGKGFPVRIDHIFVSNHWQTDSTHVDAGLQASDHRPILTRLYRANAEE